MLPRSKILRALIYIPAKLYELAIRLRMVLYEYEYLKPQEVEKTAVISIGNLTLGGTGKTPLVEYIARYLVEENLETAILTRGYRRQDSSRAQLVVSDGKNILATVEEAGDEPFMLAQKLKGVRIVVGANRYETGCYAQDKLGCDVLLLDDGYQHLSLKRDLNILVLDATDPFGGGEMVPYGRMREPIYAMRRAQAIIITRADRPFDQEELSRVIDGLGLNIPIIYAYHDFVGLRELTTGAVAPLRKLNGARVGMLCAIGNPQIFTEDLQGYQAQIVFEHTFTDHYHYRQADIDNIVTQAQEAQAEYLVTTEKDAVKLTGLQFGAMPVYVIEIKAQFEDEVKLKSVLLRAIMRKRGMTRFKNLD
ncbi:MAG: tetraacyldisaccharide 4'-kinase [Acidobacteriota bacterium]